MNDNTNSEFACPRCGANLFAPTDMAAQSRRCNRCNTVVNLPTELIASRARSKAQFRPGPLLFAGATLLILLPIGLLTLAFLELVFAQYELLESPYWYGTGNYYAGAQVLFAAIVTIVWSGHSVYSGFRLLMLSRGAVQSILVFLSASLFYWLLQSVIVVSASGVWGARIEVVCFFVVLPLLAMNGIYFWLRRSTTLRQAFPSEFSH